MQTRALFFILSGSGVGESCIYNESVPEVLKEWKGLCGQEGISNNALSAPKLAEFLFIYLGLVGLCTQTVLNAAISTFWNVISLN